MNRTTFLYSPKQLILMKIEPEIEPEVKKGVRPNCVQL